MTPLSYALLGLIRAAPRSGYALRKEFETTPIGNYSSSPGSIYPALKSLETERLVVVGPVRSARGKGLYDLTAEGRAALQAWLGAPSTDIEEGLLRFAFLPEEDGPAILDFLEAFEALVARRLADLDAFLAGDAGQSLSPKSRIAVDHGRRVLQASADWATATRSAIRKGL